MTLRGINFRSLAFAGLAAAYVMYFVDHWFAGFLGLFGMFPGTSNAWWMLQHHVEGLLFGVAFAWPGIYERLPGERWSKGLVFGIAWTIALAVVSLIAGGLGATAFRRITSAGAAGVVTMILLHLTWGVFLGGLYVPPKEAREAVASTSRESDRRGEERPSGARPRRRPAHAGHALPQG